MNIITLKNQIVNNNLNHFYVFAGEEISLANIYLNKMGNVVRIDSVADIFSKLKTRNKLFKTQESIVYVVRDDSDFINNPKVEELINQIKYNTLVVCCTELKKNSKFYKICKDYLIEFNPMTTEQLKGEVKRLLPMSNEMTEQLILACDNNYGAILSEIDKVKYSDISVIEELIENSRTYTVFTFIDLLFNKDYKAVNYIIKLLEDSNNNALGALTLIFARASQLLQIQQGVSPSELNDWQCKKIMKNNTLNQRDLYRAMRWSKLYSEGIKNGEYSAYDGLLLCVMKILNNS